MGNVVAEQKIGPAQAGAGGQCRGRAAKAARRCSACGTGDRGRRAQGPAAAGLGRAGEYSTPRPRGRGARWRPCATAASNLGRDLAADSRQSSPRARQRSGGNPFTSRASQIAGRRRRNRKGVCWKFSPAHGISRIDPALGGPFDPHFHQANVGGRGAPPHPAGTVAQVLQPGYVQHERLLRPALVGVAAGSGGDDRRRPATPANDEDHLKPPAESRYAGLPGPVASAAVSGRYSTAARL